MKLGLKILIPIVGIMFVAVIAIIFVTIQILQNAFFKDEATSLSNHVDKEVREIFTPEDLQKKTVDEDLRKKFKQLSKAVSDPSVFRVKIWDKNWQVVYSDLDKLIGTRADEDQDLGTIFRRESLFHWSLISQEQPQSTEKGFGSYVHVLVPIQDMSSQTQYVIELYSSVAAIVTQLQGASINLIYFLTVIALFILTSIYLMIHFIVINPIKKLERAMNIISAGDLTRELISRSKDEIGVLSNNFNDMRVKLKGLIYQIEQEKAGVEKKVEVRTYELQREHIKLEASINSINIAFIITDRTGQVVSINEAAKKIFFPSAPPYDPHGYNVQLIHKQLEQELDLLSNIQLCISQRKNITIKDVSFKNRYILIRITPIILNNPQQGIEIIGTAVLIEDVTEERILQRSRDEFFSIASHELRTPLTAIRGNSSLIKQFYSEQLKDKELIEMINDIHASSVRLIEIVNDFLNTSRLELGKMQFKKERVNLVEIVEKIVKEYNTTGSEKNLSITFDTPNVLIPEVIADTEKVKEVIINLIGNSLKYTDTGGIRIELKVDNGFVKVIVHDTGHGISPENQLLLFRKFQQAASSIYTRDTTKGTGLGLYISKMMIEGMNGRIKLEYSEVGKGSTFSISLPIGPETIAETNINQVQKTAV